MTANPEPNARHRSRTILRQKLESLYRSGVQQLTKPLPSAVPVVQEVAIVAEPRPETPLAASAPSRPSAPPVRAAAGETTRTPAAPVTEVRVSESPAHVAAEIARTPPAAPPVGSSPAAPATPAISAAGLPLDRRAAALAALRSEVVLCRRCDELAQKRTQTVFGVGNPHPRLCFLGEAPGADEDRQGEPFVGAAGQLLDKIIAACTLKREDVYILNVLKCRPPGNRTPLPDEVANCRPFFERQLEILQPEFICCLGAVAAQTLLRTTRPVGQLRGKFHTYRSSQVVVTYHPAYLLRTPEMKRHTWDDMKMLMQAMGIPIPSQ
jgi:DNA polymerase